MTALGFSDKIGLNGSLSSLREKNIDDTFPVTGDVHPTVSSNKNISFEENAIHVPISHHPIINCQFISKYHFLPSI